MAPNKRMKRTIEGADDRNRKIKTHFFLQAAGYSSVGLLIVVCLSYVAIFRPFFKDCGNQIVKDISNMTIKQDTGSNNLSNNSVLLKNGMPLHDLHKLMDSDDLMRIFGAEHVTTEEYEIINIVKRKQQQGVDPEYTFAAFGKNFTLKAKPSTPFPIYEKTVVQNTVPTERISMSSTTGNCHFRYVNNSLVAAAFSHCSPDEILGYLINDDVKIYEIKPLGQCIRKILALPVVDDDFEFVGAHVIRPVDPAKLQGFERNLPKQGKDGNNKRIELAIFIDYPTFNDSVPFVNADVDGKPSLEEFRELVLAFVNGVQGLLHHPGLSQRVDLSLVKLEITRKFTSSATDPSGLLADFCEFQANKNPQSDAHWGHWDLAILLTNRMDFPVENKTAVLTHRGGVCSMRRNCIISEFGTKRRYGDEVSSIGFDGIFAVAQGIAESLDMNLDGVGNSCTEDDSKTIPAALSFGQRPWQSCSVQELTALSKHKCLDDSPGAFFWDLQHTKYGERPGQWFSADNQCQFLLRDKSAKAVGDVNEVCRLVTCQANDLTSSAGPALAGTACGPNKWCVRGQCVAVGS